VQPLLDKLCARAEGGRALNFRPRGAPRPAPGRLYLEPADVLQFALTLTSAVRMDHTYMPNDFTLCMYRKPPWEDPGMQES
jgi:hypothetical protein